MTTEEHIESTIENLLREDRTFPPPQEFVSNALLNDPSIYERTDTEEGFRAFWTEEGNRLDWMEPWSELYTWEAPYTQWYLGGKLNVSVNCLDRHVRAGLGDRVAYHWEGEPGDTVRVDDRFEAARRDGRVGLRLALGVVDVFPGERPVEAAGGG